MKLTCTFKTRYFCFTFLPTAFIVLFCGLYFIGHVNILFAEYFLYVPIVLSRSVNPSSSEFPAITICAPRGWSNSSSLLGLTLDEILHNHTIQYEQLILGCFLMVPNNSRRDRVLNCSSVANLNIVESLQHDGRKCFTHRDWTVQQDDMMITFLLNPLRESMGDFDRRENEEEEELTYNDTAFTVHTWFYLPKVESELIPVQIELISLVDLKRAATRTQSGILGVTCRNYDDRSSKKKTVVVKKLRFLFSLNLLIEKNIFSYI